MLAGGQEVVRDTEFFGMSGRFQEENRAGHRHRSLVGRSNVHSGEGVSNCHNRKVEEDSSVSGRVESTDPRGFSEATA